MTVRNPLVIVNGRIQELPAGDTVIGSSAEEVMYSKRIDSISDAELYKGEAVPGALSSASAWRICKVSFAVDGDVSITWAEGTDAFTKIWDNRLSYTYS